MMKMIFKKEQNRFQNPVLNIGRLFEGNENKRLARTD